MVVEFEGYDGSSTTGRLADNFRTIRTPSKMFAPILLPRIEKLDRLTDDGINVVCLRGFVTIAQGTGQPQIVFG